MTERNREWEMLGNIIASLAAAGARPWELRLLALKGKHVSLRDMARIAAKYEQDVRGPRLETHGPNVYAHHRNADACKRHASRYWNARLGVRDD